MEEWFAEFGLTAAVVVVGILVCTGGGLLSLTTDPEQPSQFVPVYAVSLAIFLGGLGLILWCEPLSAMFRDSFLSG